jgi:ubiquinone/menaquinone biosynthesis C-methylase UbiE
VADANAPTNIRHPLFARFQAWLSTQGERHGVGEHRDELLAGLSGRVVEVGAGSGTNFRHYPVTVSEVVAVEPEPYLRARALESAREAPIRVQVRDAVAERLPLEDSSVDAGVASLVLCSVGDPDQALSQLYRVIRPGGELRFYEHVRADTAELMRLQRTLDLVWPKLGGGCHLTRDTELAITRAGFLVEACRRFRFQPCALAAPTSPIILGVARRPAN